MMDKECSALFCEREFIRFFAGVGVGGSYVSHRYIVYLVHQAQEIKTKYFHFSHFLFFETFFMLFTKLYSFLLAHTTTYIYMFRLWNRVRANGSGGGYKI